MPLNCAYNNTLRIEKRGRSSSVSSYSSDSSRSRSRDRYYRKRSGRSSSYSSSSSRSRSRSPSPKKEKKHQVFVTGISRNLTEEHVQEIFSNYGKIKKLDLSKDAVSGFHRGNAIIEYETKEEAQKAIDFMGEAQVDGRIVKVSLYDASKSSPSDARRDRRRSPYRGRFATRYKGQRYSPYRYASQSSFRQLYC